MYSRRIVAAKRAAVEAALRKPFKEYSLGEVAENKKRLEKVDWKAGVDAVLASLPADLAQFIINEQTLCPLDFEYFLRRYVKVEDKHGRIINFVPRVSQQILLAKFGELEEATHPLPMGKIALALVKARRVGGTALAQAMISHGFLMHSNAKALTGSDTPKNTLELYKLQNMMYDNYPEWLRPRLEGRVKLEHMICPDRGSDLFFTFGDAKTTIQGKRMDYVHATEVSTWAYADMLDDDIWPMFRSSDVPTSFSFLETTGKSDQGSGRWFEEHYRAAQAGEGPYRAIFLSWYQVPEQHTQPADGVTFKPTTLAVAERVKRDSGWECTREQLAWYQYEREGYEAKNKLQDFLAEYPTTWDEAFQHGTRSAISLEARDRVRQAAKKPEVVLKWDDAALKFTDVTTAWKVGDSPLQHAFVFEAPERGFTYVIGVDGAHGDPEYDKDEWTRGERDPSAVEVLKVAAPGSKPEQVASWFGYIAPDDLSIIAEKFGRMYGDQTNEGYPAMMACEVNAGSPSAMTQMELLRKGYPHFYIWPKPNKVGGGYTNSIGWETTPKSRPWITSGLIKDIEAGDLVVNSLVTIEQMKTFVKTRTDSGQTRIDHEPGFHDDSLFALGIALYCSQDQMAMNLAMEAWRAVEKSPEARPDVNYQATGIVLVDDGSGRLVPTVVTPGFVRGDVETAEYTYELPS